MDDITVLNKVITLTGEEGVWFDTADIESINDATITADDLVGTYDTADHYIASDGTAEMDFSDYSIEISEIVLDGENIMIGSVSLSDYIKKEAGMQYLTVGNVLLMVVVCVVTVKFIIPRLNIRWLVRKFKNFIYRPFKKAEKEAKVVWDKAETEAKEEWKL